MRSVSPRTYFIVRRDLTRWVSIERRQDLVECMIVEADLRRAVSVRSSPPISSVTCSDGDDEQDDYLKAMPDLHRIAKRFQKGVASLEDVVRVYQCIIKLPEMVAALESGGADNEEWKNLIKEIWLDHLKVRRIHSFSRL